MKGRELALATLRREGVDRPCINYCWMTNTTYMSRLAGRNYWDDREGVFFDYLLKAGINLVPQWYYPGDAHKRLEEGLTMHDAPPNQRTPEEIVAEVEALPSDEQVERGFNVEQAARQYAEAIKQRMARAHDEVLFIDHFGQADFMGGYTRWGYESYLMTIALHPEAMRRYYHHTALKGRLLNQAIGLAREKHGIAPFVYGGQDICTSGGPIIRPDVLRNLYFPELRWCMEPLIEAGIGVIWHCDGNINPILDDILNLGVSGLQGFEEEHGVDYARMVSLKDRNGAPLAIWGCVSVTTTLPHGTVADVKASVERSFVLAGKRRGFVLSSTSSIMPEAPHENIDALFHHGKAFGTEFLAS